MTFTRSMNIQKETGGVPTVLVVDLDKAVAAYFTRKLRDSGYHVLEAPDWNQAVSLVRFHSRPIHILLTDMNKANHPALAETLKMYRPTLQVLFISEHADMNLPNVLDPETALTMVRTLLKSTAD